MLSRYTKREPQNVFGIYYQNHVTVPMDLVRSKPHRRLVGFELGADYQVPASATSQATKQPIIYMQMIICVYIMIAYETSKIYTQIYLLELAKKEAGDPSPTSAQPDSKKKKNTPKGSICFTRMGFEIEHEISFSFSFSYVFVFGMHTPSGTF